MKHSTVLIHSTLAIAIVWSSLTIPAAHAQTTDPGASPMPDAPIIVIEDRSLRERLRDRDVTLAEPLEVTDAAGDPIVTLPAETTVGRERLETRFAAEDQPIRNRTDLRRVTLSETTTLTDRRTGEMIELPAGTVLRVKLDQRFDADGNVVRDRIDIRAVQPDGTKIRIRDRSPEIEVNDIEVENEVRDNHRQRGRDVRRPEDNSGDRIDRSEQRGRDRAERAERANRSGRGERPERVDRSGRGGGKSGRG